MKQMSAIGWVSWVLIVIGALNWGLIGINGSFNLVAMIFGADSLLSRIVYIVIGVAALVSIYCKIKCHVCCKSDQAIVNK